jgi:hypothetical protein
VEGIDEWIQFQSAELQDWYSSPITLQVITYRRTRWAGHVAQTEGKNADWDLVEIAEENIQF